MRELISGIFTWPWFSQPHGYNFNGYFVRHAGGNLCIDPVEPPTEAIDQIGQEGAAWVVLTNRNHVRASKKIRERTSARVAIHPADAAHARKEGGIIDHELHVGEQVGPFTVMGAPGKSPGEVVLHWPERKILVVGDAVIGNPPGSCGLLKEQVMDDPARLRTSVRGLLDLDFDILLVGDGTPLLSGAKAKLQELVAGFPV